jgi:hypothetical protein
MTPTTVSWYEKLGATLKFILVQKSSELNKDKKIRVLTAAMAHTPMIPDNRNLRHLISVVGQLDFYHQLCVFQ